jgi:hypothetical protein
MDPVQRMAMGVGGDPCAASAISYKPIAVLQFRSQQEEKQ